MTFKIEFQGADNYIPFEGSGSDLLNFEGLTFGDIQEVELGEAPDSGNKTMKFTVLVADDESVVDRVNVRALEGRRCSGLRVGEQLLDTFVRRRR